MNFKKWLLNNYLFQELRISDEILKLIDNSYLDVDKNGNIVEYNPRSGVYFNINKENKSLDISRISPLSKKFHKFIKTIKKYIHDILDFEVNVYFQAAHMQSDDVNFNKRKVKYWMELDPVDINDKMPEFLYHGTSSNLYNLYIKKYGLKSRGASGVGGSYGSQNIDSLSKDDLIYLSVHPDAAAREASNQASKIHGGYPLILQIRTSNLDQQRLHPDEDTKSTNPKKSIEIASVLAYQGLIPSDAIIPHSIKKDKKWQHYEQLETTENPLLKRIQEEKHLSLYQGDYYYYILLDAGIIDENGNVVNKNITNDQLVKFIKKGGVWADNARSIYKSFSDGFIYNVNYQYVHKKHLTTELKTILNEFIKLGILEMTWENESKMTFQRRAFSNDKVIAFSKLLQKKNFSNIENNLKKTFQEI